MNTSFVNGDMGLVNDTFSYLVNIFRAVKRAEDAVDAQTTHVSFLLIFFFFFLSPLSVILFVLEEFFSLTLYFLSPSRITFFFCLSRITFFDFW